MLKRDPHIDPLTDRCVCLKPQFLFPEFPLPYKDQSDRAFRIEIPVQQETEFFPCFLIQQMRFIKDTYHALSLRAPDALYLPLQDPLGIPTVYLCFFTFPFSR